MFKKKKKKKGGGGVQHLKKKEKKREQHRVLSTSTCGNNVFLFLFKYFFQLYFVTSPLISKAF